MKHVVTVAVIFLLFGLLITSRASNVEADRNGTCHNHSESADCRGPNEANCVPHCASGWTDGSCPAGVVNCVDLPAECSCDNLPAPCYKFTPGDCRSPCTGLDSRECGNGTACDTRPGAYICWKSSCDDTSPTPTPTPPIQTNPPTCELSGPTQLCPDQTYNFSATCTDSNKDLDRMGIYKRPLPITDPTSVWSEIVACPTPPGSVFPLGTETATCSKSVNLSVGKYYVTVNGFDKVGNKCSGNPICMPYSCGPGWADCGPAARLTVEVDSRFCPPPNRCEELIVEPTPSLGTSYPVGQVLKLICRSKLRFDHANFRYQVGSTPFTLIGRAPAPDPFTATSINFTISSAGSHIVQCQICTQATDDPSSCTVWGKAEIPTPTGNPTGAPTRPPTPGPSNTPPPAPRASITAGQHLIAAQM